jgi:hypothetical protein
VLKKEVQEFREEVKTNQEVLNNIEEMRVEMEMGLGLGK